VKTAVRAVSEGLRREAGPNLRVSVVSPGFVAAEFVRTVSDDQVREQLLKRRDTFAISPDAIARAIAFAIEQPPEVDVNEIVMSGRPPKPEHDRPAIPVLRAVGDRHHGQHSAPTPVGIVVSKP
jgi:hypothetical protein